MHEPFSANRLRFGRQLRGIFIQEVAARARVSSRSISAWENGTTIPAEAHLATLAEVLGVPREFFAGSEPPALPAVLFRNQGRLTARQRDMALAAGTHAVTLDGWLAGQTERPLVALPDLGTMAPERAAAALRERWSLGDEPISPLIPLLDRFGVRVYSLGYPKADVDAYSLWFGEVPFILLNTSISAARRRVCTAHELGHLVLHASASGHGTRKLEVEADVFAAAFLMPAAPVLARAPETLTISSIEEARRVWGVPSLVYLRRLYDLERLPEWRFRSLCIAAKVRAEPDAADDVRDEGTSPFLAECLAQRPDGTSVREAAASHLRVYVPDLDAITFTPAAPVGA